MSKTQSETSAAAAATPVTFRDKAFKSRVLILPDGRDVPVENYMVTTSDPDVISHLDKHGDFERQAPATQPE